MRIVVSGGAGFIGSRLVRKLAHSGHEIVVVDDLSKGSLVGIKDLLDAGVVKLNKHDIRVVDGLGEMLRGCDALIHLAAVSTVPEAEADLSKAFTVNVVGTENLLKISAEIGLDRIVFASSAAVYGDNPRAVSENTKPNPLGVYGSTKLLGERLLESYSRSHNIKSVALRIFNVYGGEKGTGVVDCFLRSCLEDKPLTIYGNGEHVRDFIHVDDVVEAIIKALKYTEKGSLFERFNIATGRPTTIIELARMILTAYGKPLRLIKHEAERSGDIRFSLADVTRAQTILDFKASTTLENWISLKARELN